MKEILTSTQITEPIFRGYLEPPGGEVRAEQTLAEIGRPEWWFASDLFGDSFKPPQGDETYLLVRFAFSLTPPENHEVEESRLSIQLHCSGTVAPVVFDLFPCEVTEEANTDVKVAIKPTLKIKKVVEVSPGSLESTIHFTKVEPIVTTAGIGGANLTWFFRKHARYPIIGTRMVYAIIGYPSAAERMTM